MDILFFFLKNSKRSYSSYAPISVGIPQDEFGEASRILANFYLQNYDESIKKLCEIKKVKYLRYSDDQIFASIDKESLKEIIYNVSKKLSKIGLNINKAKVKYLSKDEFNDYWAFDFFKTIEKTKYEDKDIRIILKYLKKQNSRDNSLTKAILTKQIYKLNNKELNEKLREKCLNDDFLLDCNSKYLEKIYDFIPKDFTSKIQELLYKSYFTQFHYNLKELLNKENIKMDDKEAWVEKIKKRIKEINDDFNS